MQRRHWWGIICLSFLCLLCLGGCGKEKVPTDSHQESENIGMPGTSEAPADEGWKTRVFLFRKRWEKRRLYGQRDMTDGSMRTFAIILPQRRTQVKEMPWSVESRFTDSVMFTRKKGKGEETGICWRFMTFLPGRPLLWSWTGKSLESAMASLPACM